MNSRTERTSASSWSRFATSRLLSYISIGSYFSPYRSAHNYRDELEPKFYSDTSSFQVTLYNLNYGTAVNATKAAIEDEKVAIAPDHLAIEVAIDKLNASQATIAKSKAIFPNMGIDGVFGRSDTAAITNDSVTVAGNLITKLKNADLIEPVSGFRKSSLIFQGL